MSNGGMIIGSNYHHFARFRLMDISRARPDLSDAKITLFAETLCAEGCDRAAVVAEYNITGSGEAREELYRYKYAIDVDGTTFSGRFLGLLRSGSLVLKVRLCAGFGLVSLLTTQGSLPSSRNTLTTGCVPLSIMCPSFPTCLIWRRRSSGRTR